MSREITLKLRAEDAEYLAQLLDDTIENLGSEGWTEEELAGQEELLKQLKDSLQ